MCRWILMWEDNRRWICSLEEALLWVMDLYFVQKWPFKVKHLNNRFVSLNIFERVWINVMFLAVWTLILTAPIHCRGPIGEQVM